jgi:hypothetical protein
MGLPPGWKTSNRIPAVPIEEGEMLKALKAQLIVVEASRDLWRERALKAESELARVTQPDPVPEIPPKKPRAKRKEKA